MQTLLPNELVCRSETELSALFNLFNQKLSEAEPYSPEWRIAYLNIDAILRARKLRIAQIRPSWS